MPDQFSSHPVLFGNERLGSRNAGDLFRRAVDPPSCQPTSHRIRKDQAQRILIPSPTGGTTDWATNLPRNQTDQVATVNVAEIAAILALRPVVTHHEIGICADRDYPVTKLTRISLGAWVQVRLRRKLAIDVNMSAAQLHPVSRQSDNPFGHKFVLERVLNHHDVAPMVVAKAGQPAVDNAGVAGFERGHHAFPFNHHCREYEVLNEKKGDCGPEHHTQENVSLPGLGFDGSLS